MMADNDPAAMMAAVAARILNKPPPPPSTSRQSNAAPRTIPPPAAPAAKAPTNVVPPPTPSFASAPLSPVEPPPPVAQEQAVRPSLGPSLFGTPEQLAEARRFSQEATSGGLKSRPGSRQRAVPSRPSSAASSSPRSSVTRSSYTHGGAPASKATSRLTPPSISAARPAPSFTALGSSLASNGVLAPLTKPQVKPDVTFGEPSTFGSAMQPSSAAAFSITDIASPKIENPVEPKPAAPATSEPNAPVATTSSVAPPHKRPKGRQSFTVDQDTNAGTDKSFAAKDSEIQKEESTPPVVPTLKVKPAEPTGSARGIKQESEESDYVVIAQASAANAEKIQAKPPAESVPEKSVTVSAADFARIMADITALTKQVAALNQRVESLESENFNLLGKVELLCQMEECRRFLGTNDAKSPFELSVKCPPGIYCKVQASAALKVADLIRRVRIASKTSPAESPVPRLAADGQELGHGLTLHEASVTSNSSVEFMHEGAAADEDEEL